MTHKKDFSDFILEKKIDTEIPKKINNKTILSKQEQACKQKGRCEQIND